MTVPGLVFVVCQHFLDDEAIDDWPASSSDMNLIQHLWDTMYHGVSSFQILPHTVQELKTVLIQVWQEIFLVNVHMT